MNFKRALGIAILLYIATFVVGIIVGLVTGIDFSGQQAISTTHWIISIVLSIILSALFSVWYFRGQEVLISAGEGLKLGLTYLLAGVVLDLLFLIPYFFVGGDSAILAYYKDIWFYVSVVFVVLTPVVIGKLKGK